MRNFINTINKTLTRGKPRMRNTFSFIQEQERIRKSTPGGRIPRDNYPYLTAGGRHSPPLKTTSISESTEDSIANIRNYLDKHYLIWKKSF